MLMVNVKVIDAAALTHFANLLLIIIIIVVRNNWLVGTKHLQYFACSFADPQHQFLFKGAAILSISYIWTFTIANTHRASMFISQSQELR